MDLWVLSKGSYKRNKDKDLRDANSKRVARRPEIITPSSKQGVMSNSLKREIGFQPSISRQTTMVTTFSMVLYFKERESYKASVTWALLS